MSAVMYNKEDRGLQEKDSRVLSFFYITNLFSFYFLFPIDSKLRFVDIFYEAFFV